MCDSTAISSVLCKLAMGWEGQSFMISNKSMRTPLAPDHGRAVLPAHQGHQAVQLGRIQQRRIQAVFFFEG
jgi:hypothetical protein